MLRPRQVTGRLLSGPRMMVVLVCVLVLLPITLGVLAYFTQPDRANIRLHEQERIGIQYIRPVSALLGLVTAARIESDSMGSELDVAVAAVDAVQLRVGAELKTSELWDRCQGLLGAVRDGSATPEQYDKLSTLLSDLIKHAARTSNLVLDQDPDCYYLVDLISDQLPHYWGQVGHAAQMAATQPAGGASPQQLGFSLHAIDRVAKETSDVLAFEFASSPDPANQEALSEPAAALARTTQRAMLLFRGVMEGEPSDLEAPALLAAISTLNQVATDRLDIMLADRITSLRNKTQAVTGLVVAVSGVLLLLLLGLARAFREVADKSDQLRRQALYDGLTGLPNRTLVLDRVDHALARARRTGDSVTVLFVDLDDFKAINDTYGHAAGDLLLGGVGARLKSVLRDSDTLGRLGGDEFVIVIEGAATQIHPEATAQRVLDCLVEPFDLPGYPDVALRVRASIGIAGGRSQRPSDLLRDADVALYEAKADGKGRYAVFSPQMQEAVRDRVELENDLRAAIGTEQMFLAYQPTVDLVTGLLAGAEALQRWQHPTRGLIEPGVFIPVAEATGLIAALGRVALEQACRQGAVWAEQGTPLPIAVNVSGRQLDSQIDFNADVRSALADSGLDPGLLTLEITETTLMRDPARSAERLRDLKLLGVRVAMDDFGTGYSSMAHLREFPIDVLKIDRSFIGGMTDSPQGGALIRTFVQLGKALGIQTHAEGIEQPAQLRALQEEGCDVGQGYLFAKPMLPEALEALISRSGGTGGALASSSRGGSWAGSNPGL